MVREFRRESNLIAKAGNDNKALFRLIDRLLHRKAEKRFPTSTSAEDLANTFVTFFEDKVTRIRRIPSPSEIPDFFSLLDISTTNCELSNFSPTSNLELYRRLLALLCRNHTVWTLYLLRYFKNIFTCSYYLFVVLKTCRWYLVFYIRPSKTLS